MDEEADSDEISTANEDIYECVDDCELEQLKQEAAQFQLGVGSAIIESIYDADKLQLLLQEKEQLLVLSAKIGQSLVAKNNELMVTIKDLESKLDAKNDQVLQLEFEQKRLRDTLRDRLYVDDEDDEGIDSADGLPNRRRRLQSSNCSSCCEVQAEAWERIKRLESDNVRLSSDLSRLNAQLECERSAARQDLMECWRRFDITEVERQQLQQKLMTKQRKIDSLTDEANSSKNEVHYLATLLAKVELEMELRLDAAAKEKQCLQSKYDEAVLRYEEYMAMYTEMRAENACLQERLRRRFRHDAVHQCASRQLSLSEELQKSFSHNLGDDRFVDTSDDLPFISSSNHRALMSSSSLTDACQNVTAAAAADNCMTCSSETELITVKMISIDDSLKDRLRTILGQPGRPGSHDLDLSLLRLSLLSEHGQLMLGVPVDQPLSQLPRDDDGLVPFIDSPTSRDSSPCGGDSGRKSVDSGYSSARRIQQFKFINGSVILRSWRRLSKPHLGTLLEVHEGVLVRHSTELSWGRRAVACQSTRGLFSVDCYATQCASVSNCPEDCVYRFQQQQQRRRPVAGINQPTTITSPTSRLLSTDLSDDTASLSVGCCCDVDCDASSVASSLLSDIEDV